MANLRTYFCSSHPWLNEHVRGAVTRKGAAHGGAAEEAAAQHCNQVVLNEFQLYSQRTRVELSKLPTFSRKWWKLSDRLLCKKNKRFSIPPLKGRTGAWVQDPQSKANLFVDIFSTKSFESLLPQREVGTNWSDDCSAVTGTNSMQDFVAIRDGNVVQVLKNSDEHSGIGPDLLPAKIIKNVVLWHLLCLSLYCVDVC